MICPTCLGNFQKDASFSLCVAGVYSADDQQTAVPHF